MKSNYFLFYEKGWTPVLRRNAEVGGENSHISFIVNKIARQGARIMRAGYGLKQMQKVILVVNILSFYTLIKPQLFDICERSERREC